MAPNRQAGETSRRVNRHQNASPYKRPVQAQPKYNPQADAGQVKKSTSLAGLFSIFNPFNYLGRKNEPPQSLPQLRAREESSSQEQEAEPVGHESDTHTELDPEGDSMVVDRALRGPLASSQKSPVKSQLNRIPFPLVSPAKPGEFTPGTAPRKNPAQATNIFPRGGAWTPASPALSAHTASSTGHTTGSPLKPIQDFLGQRTRAGAGLSPEEVQQLTGMLSAQNIGRDESDLPAAAFLARDLSPSPSRSFLAPQQASSPFRFEAGNNVGSTAMSGATSSRQRRHRPIYVGPGQGANVRPSKSIAMPPISASLPRPSLPPPVAEPKPAEEMTGKRRRVDGSTSSAAPSLFTAQDSTAVQAHTQTIDEPRAEGTSTAPSEASKAVPAATTRAAHLRGHSTASPVVPSPLRNMTKADDPPSPPRRSITSATVMNIIAKADKELITSESKAEVEQAIVNPYERSGPKIRSSTRRKPIPVKKPAPPPPKEEPKKPELPSSAQAIADSLPTPKPSASKTNGNVFKAPFAKPTSSSSPFLPPTNAKTTAAPKTNGSGSRTFTVDDVDDDEVMEVSGPEASTSQPNGTGPRARGPSPPPIVVEELNEEDMVDASQKVAKPSVVVEPTEPKRIGRSPSIGPYPNLYSPTIPSPLRLVSMPEEDELAEDIDLPDAAIQPPQSFRAAALELLPKPVDIEMGDDSNVDPKTKAEKTPVTSLPSFKFDFTVTAVATIPGIDESAKTKAKDASEKDLPKFDMLIQVATPVTASTASVAPVNNWAAAGFVAKPAAGGSWTCSQCMLSNPDSAKDKCTICDADRPGAKAMPAQVAPPPPTQPAPVNNWAASGFTFAKQTDGEWTCNQCMLKNSAAAKEKCQFCEADKPGAKQQATTSTAAPPPSAGPAPSFNWAASGFKPQAPVAGTWTCGLCGLKNGADLKKCGVCEAPKP